MGDPPGEADRGVLRYVRCRVACSSRVGRQPGTDRHGRWYR